MGNTTSQNIVDSVVKIVQKSITTVMQKGSVSAVNITGGTLVAKGDITVSHITIDQNIKVVSTTVMNASTKTDFSTDISEKMTQMAKTVGQQLSLNPGSIQAINIVTLSNNLTQEIINNFNQITEVQLSNQAEFNLVSGGNIVATYITVNQGIDSILKQVMNATSVQSSLLKLAQETNQSASAKQENMFNGLFLVLAVVIGGGLVAGKKLMDPKVFLPISGVGGIGYWYMTSYKPNHPNTTQ